jgi:hypothetical protein
MNVRVFLLCMLGICAACGSHKPQAKPQQSSFERTVIPAARSRALYFSLAFTDSLSSNQVAAVYINSTLVPFAIQQQQNEGTVEVYLLEPTHENSELEELSSDALKSGNAYERLKEATAYSAVIALTRGDSLSYPNLTERTSTPLRE